MATDGNYTHYGDQFVIYINVQSLCCTPETNITLYGNDIKNNKQNFKKDRVAEWVKNKIHLCAAHKGVNSGVRTYTESKRRDRKSYRNQNTDGINLQKTKQTLKQRL